MALYPLLRPLLFRMDAERAHHFALAALARMPARRPAYDPGLAVTVAGIDFPSPVGLAAGLDKDAAAADALLGLGFGSVEVGTVTPQPQAGNPRPRLFRLEADEGIINRMGFNNRGHAAAFARLARRDRSLGIVGVNIGANKDAADRIADYAVGVRTMAPVADYLTVNISSPNTPGLRSLQDAQALDALLEAVMAARPAGGPPIFLKIAPDLAPADIDAIARVVIDRRVDALIIGNTTLSRPPLASRHRDEAGGLSGKPLQSLAAARLRDVRRATGGGVPLVAVGGIDSGAEAYARICAGASLVQIYSAIIFSGPSLPRRIQTELAALLVADGHSSIRSAIGIGDPSP
ncbi:quinone-dependent dihydroorotate dehydrogenase [Sphingomonas nostoxanthinifaciens]|uniref:quinone-dependent dihydroorotate dehydrogenase n=1 Tax=Sphingomonas nostoxanthinifaciens TaxID=2872652 RepID=UPI001CC1F0C1|nr:quinone-dependent dihydroorotate dehydrogenase [Sphingomonas nostoxanthinifaciens]UAK24577.1 quinone-dependent dihydroorotate dehydrogenase [Sphingomonas nostoxanthinifaciens]